MKKIKLVISFLLLFYSSMLVAQSKGDSLVLYTSDYKFTEGVYTDFMSVISNTPIPKSRILSNYSYSDKEFFDKVLAEKNIIYYDFIGNKLGLKTSSIWGYSRNGFLYVNVNDGFFRITLIGSICHFIVTRTHKSINSMYNTYNPNYPPQPTSTTTEMRQYLLDFKTGNMLEYNIEGMEVVLMTDPELHDEYMQLSRKKKKQLKFVYIRKFNERNPLYLKK